MNSGFRLVVLGVVLWAACTGAETAGAAGSQAFVWAEPHLLAPEPPGAGAGPGRPILDVACATAALCLAITRGGSVLTTANGLDGPWSGHAAGLGHELVADSEHAVIACPSVTLCLVAGERGIVALEAPWTLTPVWAGAAATPAPVSDISCPGVSLCVAVDEEGAVLTATHPAGGPTAWRAVTIDAAGAPLVNVECPSADLCVTVDRYRNVLTSRDPTGRSSSWRAGSLPGAASLWTLSCPSTTFCLAVDDDGSAVASLTPADGGSGWQAVGTVGRSSALQTVCPTADRCLVAGEDWVAVSDDPTGGFGRWGARDFDASLGLRLAACSEVTRCLVFGARGWALVGTADRPAGDIEVELLGDGEGAVAGAGLSCPGVCRASLARGGSVELTAAPRPGSTFSGWAGACSGTGACVVTIASLTRVSAGFALVPPAPGFVVSVSIGGEGVVTGPGVSCPPTCRASRPLDAPTPLVATPAAGWRFARWAGACGGSGRCELTAGADRAVLALFERVAPDGRARARSRSRSRTRLTVRGTVRGKRATATFRLGASGRRATIRCALVRRSGGRRPARPHRFARCRSPKTYVQLRRGRYAFHARVAGQPRQRATWRFRVR